MIAASILGDIVLQTLRIMPPKFNMFFNLTQNVFQLGLWYGSDLARSNLRTIVPRTQAGFLTQVYHGKSLNDQDHHYKKYIDRQLNPTMDILSFRLAVMSVLNLGRSG